jgi:hypothetical protein
MWYLQNMKTTPTTPQTKDEIVALLMENSLRGAFAVERALLVLYSRQTADEQASDTTAHENGMGFSGSDAEFFSKLARQVMTSTYEKGRRLSPKQLDAARGIKDGAQKKRGITKYAGQLLSVVKATTQTKATVEAAVAASEAA